MVRNFHILNRRPFWPTRSGRNEMEPGEPILISAGRSRNKGEPSANSTDESTTSQNRLAHSWPIQRELLLTEANSTPSISSYPTPESHGKVWLGTNDTLAFAARTSCTVSVNFGGELEGIAITTQYD